MPKKSDILIFDRVTEKSGFAKIIFKKKNYEVIDVRYESVCLPILINVIFKFGFTRIKENYFAEFIRKVSPKIIYTAIDNNMDFYKLKLLYDKCIYISDQFGISKNAYASFKGLIKKDFFWHCKKFNKTSKKKLKADIIFVFGNYEKNKMSKYIDGNYFTLGSTKNNHFYNVEKKDLSKIKDILFICSGKYNATIETEKLYFKYLISFCNKNNINVNFLSRFGQDMEDFYRQNYAKGSWTYIPRTDMLSSYNIINKQKMVVFTHGTVGFEAFAKNIKCAVFYSDYPEKGGIFHKPRYKSKGPFWTNSKKFDEFEKILKRVIKYNNQEWMMITKKYARHIMNYDPDNYQKKKIIYKFL